MTDRPGRIRWLAVAAGYFADYFISLVIAGIGVQFDPNLARGISFGSIAGAVTAVLLVLSTGVGGWIAGRLAKQEYVLHGVLIGGIGIIDMLISSFFGEQIALTNILLQFAAVAVGALGGWLSQWMPARQEQ